MSRVIRAFLQALQSEFGNQLRFANAAKVQPSRITKILAGRPPTYQTLRLLVHTWSDKRHGLEILAAHLRDVIDEARVPQTQIAVTIQAGAVDPVLEHSLVILRGAAVGDELVRQQLVALAEICDRYRAGPPAPDLRTPEERAAARQLKASRFSYRQVAEDLSEN